MQGKRASTDQFSTSRRNARQPNGRQRPPALSLRRFQHIIDVSSTVDASCPLVFLNAAAVALYSGPAGGRKKFLLTCVMWK